MSRIAADAVAAWATGVGIGLLAFMITWLIGHRIAELVWDPPVGPIVGLGAAILVGGITAIVAGRRLSRTMLDEPSRADMA
jgi:hypothetical protein